MILALETGSLRGSFKDAKKYLARIFFNITTTVVKRKQSVQVMSTSTYGKYRDIILRVKTSGPGLEASNVSGPSGRLDLIENQAKKIQLLHSTRWLQVWATPEACVKNITCIL